MIGTQILKCKNIRIIVLMPTLAFLIFSCAGSKEPKPGASPPPPKPAPAPPPTTTPATQLDVKDHNITLLVRDFLVTGEKEKKYGYYCYLLFYSNNFLTYEQRITAANAFMCNFWDANKEDVRLEDPKNLAVFYAPVEKIENLNSLRESELGEDLLDAYNYYSAQKIINKLADKYDIDKLEVSIVASPVPLGALESKLDYDVVQVISLVDMPPPHIAKIICELRKNITHPAEIRKVGNFFIPVLIDEDAGVDLSLKFRRFLGSIGELVTTIGKDAHAQDFLCK